MSGFQVRPATVFLAALSLLSAPLLRAEATQASITDELKKLRAVPVAERPAATKKIALEIQALPAGPAKLGLADYLSHLATEGDAGRDNLQAVTDTLAEALKQSPPAPKGDHPPAPYKDLAKLVRYEHLNHIERSNARQGYAGTGRRRCRCAKGRFHPQGFARKKSHPFRIEGQNCLGQLLGYLVPAMSLGDA